MLNNFEGQASDYTATAIVARMTIEAIEESLRTMPASAVNSPMHLALTQALNRDVYATR